MNILAIEGQGNLGFVNSLLIAPLAKQYKFEVERRAWSDPIKLGKYDVVIGHSLGGQSAITTAALCSSVKYLVTLDPRHQSNLSMFDILFPWQKKFKAPPRVKAFNFTHSPPVLFPGYEVVGATNQSLFTNHLTIPGHKAVRDCLAGILEGKL